MFDLCEAVPKCSTDRSYNRHTVSIGAKPWNIHHSHRLTQYSRYHPKHVGNHLYFCCANFPPGTFANKFLLIVLMAKEMFFVHQRLVPV